MVKFHATSLNPESSTFVWFQGTVYMRDELETAWLLLAEKNLDRIDAMFRMKRELESGVNQALRYLDAAEKWTGKIVLGGGDESLYAGEDCT